MLCDCSVTAVGGERLPSPSINNAVVSPTFSHLSLFSAACLSSLPFTSTMGKNNKHKREPTPPSEDFGDSEYSEEEFSSESEGSPAPILLTQTTPRGSRRRSGRTSGPSSAPGLRARMSRSTPRMRRTRTTAARTKTTTTTKAVAAVTVTAAAGVAAGAARTVTAAAAGATAAVAAAAEAVPGAAAVAAATGPVARCHWSFRY
jgi:hypothetical protein